MRSFTINDRIIGQDCPPYIVAEVSANHNGSMEAAKNLIEVAKRAGADAVKLQTYRPETITLNSSKSDFQILEGLWKGRTLYELYDWAHTPWEWHKALFDYAHELGITIFSTPFDESAVDFLEELKTPAYKIASFECTDLTLIRKVAETGKPLIISTGMANKQEICEAVDTAKKYGSGELVLLHCVSGYPAEPKEYNLKTMRDMSTTFEVNVGLSDHTVSNVTSIASVALGAVMIEKHITLDRNAGGPDDSFSLEEADLQTLCNESKIAWEAIGKTNYEQTTSEKSNTKFRRSLYFVSDMKAGDIINSEHVRSVRPGYGLAPKYLEAVIGRKVIRDIEKHTPVKLDLLSGYK